MKKSSLTTAVLAGLVGVVGFAGSANAVELNSDGTGQVLIYPYYTVHAEQQTLISVVNSTEAGKAVKVRFLEGYNSREVLDFNLFLSPYDVWTAVVGETGSGAGVATSDTSCTVPAIPSAGQPFTNLGYTGLDADGGLTGLERTREGYVEMISMADVIGNSLDAITHVSGVPANCGASSLRANNPDFIAPSGGLFGNGAIVNVPQGTFYPYAADAIDGFTENNLFSDSGSVRPSLTDAETPSIGGPGTATAYVFQSGGGVVTATYTRGEDAVSAVFAASALMNEWVASSDHSQGTDWVVTFPTKRFYVDPDLVSVARAPFVEMFSENADGQSCFQISMSKWDREEGQLEVIEDDQFSPPPPGQAPSSLCHEVNVISISDSNDPISILGSEFVDGDTGLALNTNPYGSAGWMKLGLNPSSQPHAMVPSTEGVVFNGLPGTGFAAQRFVNEDLVPGVLSNYSGAWRHRVERNIGS